MAMQAIENASGSTMIIIQRGLSACAHFFIAALLAASLPAQAGTTYNAKTFGGAVGNGIVDDAGAIQKAIDAAIAAGPGNTVLLPTGRYLISKQLVIEKARSLTFTGAPGVPPLLLTTPKTGFVFDVLHSDHVTINNVANDAQESEFHAGDHHGVQRYAAIHYGAPRRGIPGS